MRGINEIPTINPKIPIPTGNNTPTFVDTAVEIGSTNALVITPGVVPDIDSPPFNRPDQ